MAEEKRLSRYDKLRLIKKAGLLHNVTHGKAVAKSTGTAGGMAPDTEHFLKRLSQLKGKSPGVGTGAGIKDKEAFGKIIAQAIQSILHS